MNVAELLTAVGALLAAVFSGLTLYLTGRRGEQRWRRDVLIEAFERYIGLSFERANGSRRAMRHRIAGVDPATWTDVVTRLGEVGREHSAALTRIRLLADVRTVRAAENQLRAGEELAMYVAESSAPPTAEERARFEAARDADWRAKEQFFDAARAELGLRGGTSIDPTLRGSLATRWPGPR